MENKHSKFRSRRWIITVWSMMIISLICILGIIFKNDTYVNIAMALVAVPVSFTSLESVNKWKKGENINDSSETFNKE